MATVSPVGLALIRRFEGCRLQAYQDSKGIWTIGYGHTGPEVTPGRVITQEQAEALLAADLARFAHGVEDSLARPVTPLQFDALVSLAYNIGLEAFRRSTVLRRLNARDEQGAAEAWIAWRDDGQPTEAGLARRRAAEIFLFGRGTR
jgi:lysozyme